MAQRRQMVQGERRHDAIHGSRRKRLQARDVALSDDDVVEPGLGDVRAGTFEHRRRKVYSGEAGSWIESRDLAKLGCRAAAEINDFAAALDDLAMRAV